MATLREIVTGKGWDATQGIVEEVSKLVPELNFFDAKIIQVTPPTFCPSRTIR